MVTVVGAYLLLSVHPGEEGLRVEITRKGIRLRRGGLRRTLVPFEDIVLVYTTMAPTREGFEEVLAVEYSSSSGEGVIVMGRAQGLDVHQVIHTLRVALGDGWDDVYVGYKHLSRGRGSP